jgi:shikimate dehydrogenase
MNLSGHTQPFAVLGHPIGHTLSPAMHNAAFKALDMDAVYLAFDVEPERLMAVLPAMAAMGFVGLNLTVPHKEVAFHGLEHLDESARLLGAVNTVHIENGVLTGYNTDGAGFLMAVEEAFGRDVAGTTLFVLGAGGAGRAVALAAARAGAGSLTLSDVDEARAQTLADQIRGAVEDAQVEVVSGAEHQAEAARQADLVVQATPIGMKSSDPGLLPPGAFRPDQHVFDLIYSPRETPLLQTAREAGAKTANGLGMLLHQGVKAFSIWTGVTPPAPVMRSVLEQAVYAS